MALRTHSVRLLYTRPLAQHLAACATEVRVPVAAWIRCVVTGAPLRPDFTDPERRVLFAISRASLGLMRAAQVQRSLPERSVVQALVRLRNHLTAPVDFAPVVQPLVPPIDPRSGNQSIMVHLTDDEHSRVKSAAKALGLPMGAWVRQTVAQVQVPPSPPSRATAAQAERIDSAIEAKRWSLLAVIAQELIGQEPAFVPTWHLLPPGDPREAWSLDQRGEVVYRGQSAGALCT